MSILCFELLFVNLGTLFRKQIADVLLFPEIRVLFCFSIKSLHHSYSGTFPAWPTAQSTFCPVSSPCSHPFPHPPGRRNSLVQIRRKQFVFVGNCIYFLLRNKWWQHGDCPQAVSSGQMAYRAHIKRGPECFDDHVSAHCACQKRHICACAVTGGFN